MRMNRLITALTLCVLVAPTWSRAADKASAKAFHTAQDTWAASMVEARNAMLGANRFPSFTSEVMHGSDAPRPITFDVSGQDDLWLMVDTGGKSGPDFGVWANPRLIDNKGKEVPLKRLGAMDVNVRDRGFIVNQTPDRKPLVIGGQAIEHGFWMTSGAVHYKLDKKYQRVEATIGVEAKAGKGGNVRFQLLTRPRIELWSSVEKDFPMECDWMRQDLAGAGFSLSASSSALDSYPVRWFTAAAETDVEKKMILNVLEELGPRGADLRTELARLDGAAAHGRPLLDLYVKACQLRRQLRLAPMVAKCRTFVFTKHYNMGGSHYAYTENQTDGHTEWNFHPGSALCLAEMDGATAKVQTLIDDPNGVIRDPDVSYDGRRILFAWKKSRDQDDYHLYEMDLATKQIRQLTFGLGVADYEGAYLPNGDIVFNSSRCVQIVDCWKTQVSNLYTCDKDGKYLRRLSFDQVHTNYPAVTDDGRVLYTRWEYNDRGQIYPQALFQMNSDGTGQTEFYGNNSWFPTTILHARNISGTQKVLAIATGHHSRQTGKLIVIDPAKGRQENAGVQLVAPVRETPAVHVDSYGQDGELFQYPYPLGETEYLTAYNPDGWIRKPLLFGIYFTTVDGRRELLTTDPKVSCNQAVPVKSRVVHQSRPNLVDYRKNTGAFYVQDIYAGPGLEGIPRGTVKKLRVIALDFRAALVGGNGNGGPAGGAFVATPVSVSNGCWDPKIVLGEIDVAEDGSAFFTVPARTPIYFQAIDGKGHMVQTMRSWSTLQPGETAACIGCHESKNAAPLPYAASTMALGGGPKPLKPFHGPARGFSFKKEIQPILNARCVSCHYDRSKVPALAGANIATTQRPAAKGTEKAFSLLADETVDEGAKRRWSDGFLALTNSRRPEPGRAFQGQSGSMVDWISPQSVPSMLPPYSAGASKSKLMTLLEEGHKDVKLSREELDKIACWIDLVIPYCGDYVEANAWTPEEMKQYEYYLGKRKMLEEQEQRNIAQYLEQLHKK